MYLLSDGEFDQIAAISTGSSCRTKVSPGHRCRVLPRLFTPMLVEYPRDRLNDRGTRLVTWLELLAEAQNQNPETAALLQPPVEILSGPMDVNAEE